MFRDTDHVTNITKLLTSDNIKPPVIAWPPPQCMPSDLLSIHQAVVNSGTYNFMSARLSLPTKINIDYLRDELDVYEDKQVLQFLQFGWPINYMGRALPRTKLCNYRGAKLHPHYVDAFITTVSVLNHRISMIRRQGCVTFTRQISAVHIVIGIEQSIERTWRMTSQNTTRPRSSKPPIS